jgi:hypothetical protein
LAAWEELEPALSQHLNCCEHCRRIVQDRMIFDDQIRSQIRTAPTPPDLDRLQSRVMQSLLDEFPAPVSTIRPFSRVISGIVIAASLLIGAGWLTWESLRPRGIPYTQVVTALVSRFVEDPRDDVARLVSFDGNFPLRHAFRQFHRLQLSEAHGIDLDGDELQDAAIFKFAIEHWRGILAVMPTRRMPGVPLGRTWVLVAGQPLLQWQSDDKKLTYLCFLQQGPMQGLADELLSDRRG